MYSFFINRHIKILVVDGECNGYSVIERNKCSPVVEIKIDKKVLRELVNIFSRALIDPIPQCCELTAREVQILQNIAKGLNNQQISNLMNLSVHTVKAHIHNIFDKLAAQDRTEAVVKAIKSNLITL